MPGVRKARCVLKSVKAERGRCCLKREKKRGGSDVRRAMSSGWYGKCVDDISSLCRKRVGELIQSMWTIRMRRKDEVPSNYYLIAPL